MAPFDRARPLWEAVVADGLADGGAIYLLKLHHSITDGQGTVQMFDILHGDTPEPGRARELPVPAPERISGAALTAQALAAAPRRAIGEALKASGVIASTLERVATNPRSIAGGLRYARSLGRMLGGPPAPSSVLLEQRSLGRRFGMIEIPLAALRAGGKAADGTLNDAFLAGLTGGMRRYHEHHGIALDELTLALPISLRTSDDPLGSNRFAGARIAAPIGELDPRRRIQLIGERSRAAREEPALNFMDVLSPALSRLPAAVVAAMTQRVTRSIDLQASNIRGLDRAAYLAGARVERMYAFGAAPGPAVMATLMSYHGTCCVAINVNAAAVPDHELFVRCMQEGLAEITSLRPGRRRPALSNA
jgi:WS/DGAT/MGAT family acyltransferase